MAFVVSEDDMGEFFRLLSPHLDERQKRLAQGAFSQMLGHGGSAAVARASGASAQVVGRGRAELEAGAEVTDRVRRAGAGRPVAEVAQPGIEQALDALVEPGTRGDPMSPLRWTTKSTRTLDDPAGRTRRPLKHHPETGAAITGETVPGWPAIKQLIIQVAGRLPFPGIVGWDVALSPDGIVIVEGNGIPGIDIHEAHESLISNVDQKEFWRGMNIVLR